MKLKDRLEELKEGILSIQENPILTSLIVLILIATVVLGLSMPYYLNHFDEFYLQVLAEAHGMIFDIAVIGILIFWMNKSGERRQRIKTYKDEIDDFRLWESEEAAYRTVGNIKRLNRHKIYNINLVDSFLAKTNLNYVMLADSNLNNANLSNAKLIETNLQNARLNQTNLENANLNQATLESAYASGANFENSFCIKVNMYKAFLIKASFKNAHLMEANLRGSYLTGADFENASLYKADLREAIGLTAEQLKKAKTLYLARFDEELLEEIKQGAPELLSK